MEERLQKVLAARGVASRRKCEELILAGRVMVNGKKVDQLGFKVDDEHDKIEVDGNVIGKVPFVYLMLHKPTGVITSASDPQGRKVVTDLVKDIKERVYPVGRLDLDTSGLLLMTNDGELANKIAHPRFEIDKVYLATVKGIPSEQALKTLREGVMLEDGMTYPAQAELTFKDPQLNQATIKLTIHEGRNRQVRRMCQAVGHPVVKLKRVQLGFLTLGKLAPRQYRMLTPQEVDKLRQLFT
ncbi:pseudouridine synthase [Ammoniphilus sp. YIM 78166]|uniref:pseudouridine synthase n=1 Tax=Ammoniphilus sp. YIM 78166 TaxID=1644106 RepID=UPI0010704AE1|nr:pseudouridine synthase [Ammoniphilus sp. YIM 78166]